MRIGEKVAIQFPVAYNRNVLARFSGFISTLLLTCAAASSFGKHCDAAPGE